MLILKCKMTIYVDCRLHTCTAVCNFAHYTVSLTDNLSSNIKKFICYHCFHIAYFGFHSMFDNIAFRG